MGKKKRARKPKSTSRKRRNGTRTPMPSVPTAGGALDASAGGASVTAESFEFKEPGTVLDCGCVVGDEGDVFHEGKSILLDDSGDFMGDFMQTFGLPEVATPAWDALTWLDSDRPLADLPFRHEGWGTRDSVGLAVETVSYPAPGWEDYNEGGAPGVLVKDGWVTSAWGLVPGPVHLVVLPRMDDAEPDDGTPPLSLALDDGTAGIITTMPSAFGVMQVHINPEVPVRGESFVASDSYPRERYAIAVVVIDGVVAAFGYEKGGTLDPLVSDEAVEHIGVAIGQIIHQTPKRGRKMSDEGRARRAGQARADLLFRRRTPLLLDPAE